MFWADYPPLKRTLDANTNKNWKLITIGFTLEYGVMQANMQKVTVTNMVLLLNLLSELVETR